MRIESTAPRTGATPHKTTQLNHDNKVIGISGFGQHHTDKNGHAYYELTWPIIKQLVDNPQAVEKSQAQWLMPSTHPSRNFKEQMQHGQYYALWSDIDQSPPNLDELFSIIYVLLGGYDFEIYTSRSATAENPKSRIIILLTSPIHCDDWMICQEILNNKLEANGVIPDRSSQRSAQLCYLPNRGEYYDKRSLRKGFFFDPLQAWNNDIQAIAFLLNKEHQVVLEKRRISKEKREQRLAAGFSSPIQAFNTAYIVEDILIGAGYNQQGNKFRHPNSESGSYSASVKDGRVYTLSSSDPLYTNGGGAHDAFSAFCVLFHSGNVKAATKDACENKLVINGMSWNTYSAQEVRK